MKDWLVLVSENAIVLIDWIAPAVIVIGTIEAAASGVLAVHGSDRDKREVWLHYARWLVAGLTFQLAADIIETSISTSWEAVARIAAIAFIRTFLNYFLEHDVSEVPAWRHEAAPAGNR